MEKEVKNVVRHKAAYFGLHIVQLTKQVRARGCDYVLIRQLLKSGTSIGANVAESHVAFTRAEFAAKMSISLKECKETEYWLWLLHKSEYIMQDEYLEARSKAQEISKLLYAILKSLRNPKPSS